MPVLANRRYPQWAPPGTPLTGPLPAAGEARREAVAARLLELARVSLAVLDADAVRECLLPSARLEISPDDYAYDIELCNTVRRGLLRVERLTDLEPQTAVWRLRPDQPGVADLVLAGTEYTSQFSAWAKFPIPLPPAMQQAFAGEPAVAEAEDGRWCSVFAPLRDSLDDVVAVLELCVALGGNAEGLPESGR
jgi:hypothetical protein